MQATTCFFVRTRKIMFCGEVKEDWRWHNHWHDQTAQKTGRHGQSQPCWSQPKMKNNVRARKDSVGELSGNLRNDGADEDFVELFSGY